MKKVWTILKHHFILDFSAPYYLSLAVFLAIGILLNYHLHIERSIDRHPGDPMRIVYCFLLYGTAYYGAAGLMMIFKKRTNLLQQKSFWLLTLSGLAILSFDSGFPYLSSILFGLGIDPHIFSWTYSVMINAVSVLLVGIPLLTVYWLAPVSRPHRYGLQLTGYDPKPYFLLLTLMIPLISIASFQPDFIAYYPTYKSNSVSEVLNIPRWLPMAIYEFFYGMDFFNLELLFRGFFIVGLSQVLGKDAVVPMVSMYCFLHFGKPIGEQISSIAGGYILGVIACYTRGIWGGVIIHVGIGWMMELAAYLSRTI